ncbi:uncharacterized protein SAPINGB_P006457 [Magnusiomyces paraingens]|uniref:3-ketoacyl-CoA thiolase n=1 Tax=Magnusiomyces paraingens TaxID=2606893 RepID=A0A5E8C663_9ASCO|nr:uncharacterized protein SAPINGB_P006457 [Saprochaete ingens]VVT58933.1 unnamed protein product [Saprochaete ingens]
MLRKGLTNVLEKLPTDVVIVSALRTPVTKAVKGGLAKMAPEELLATVLKGTLEKTNINPAEVQDVLVGAVLQKLSGQKACAAAIKHVGFPHTTTVNTINRQCSSSAQAASYLANNIRANNGEYFNIGIAAGVESMSFDYFPHRGIPERVADSIKNSPIGEARDVLMPMGITSENVAKEFGISRADQDAFGLLSQQKAVKAWESGHFDAEIVPVEARVFDKETGEIKENEWTTITKDDGFRKGLTIEKLAKLKPAFTTDGTTTAGNSSQISDGASATLLMTRAKADALGLKPIGKIVHSAVAGVPSRLMGIAPAVAVPTLLKQVGLETKDIDIWELNEAFASQSLYVIRTLGLDVDKVNPFGGAIALGHPLGATGGRLIATLMNGLNSLDKELGIVSMCASTGQGYAGLFARE